MKERKIIQGGEQWLPFARARAKALARADGWRAQKFTMPDGATVHVSVNGERSRIWITGGVDLWLLVTANPVMVPVVTATMGTNQDGSGAPVPSEVTGTFAQHTKLYKLKPPYNPASAMLVYEGSTSVTTVLTFGFYAYDPNPPHEGLTYDCYSVTNTYSRTGAHGAINGFVPWKGQALMWFIEPSYSMVRSDTPGVSANPLHSTEHWDYLYKFVWGGHSYDYTASQDYEWTFDFSSTTTINDSQTGDQLDSMPAMLARGEADFRLQALSGVHSPGTRTPRFEHIILTDAAPASDPDGVDRIVPLSERLGNPYSRREVGHQLQSAGWLFDYPTLTTAALYNREYTKLRDAPNFRYAPFGKDKLIGPSASGAASLSFFSYADTEGKKIDLTLLPGISSDAIFASNMIDLTAPQRRFGSNATDYGVYDGGSLYGLKTAFDGAFTEPAPGVLWNTPSVGAATASISASAVLDQAALWR